MNSKNVVYWITTALLCLVLIGGGGANLARARGTLDVMRRLGYPPYILTILGVWKMLGAVALLAPGFPRLKEWAYAGVFFEMTGAAASHAMSGTPAWNIGVTLGFALLTIVSWARRPPSRIVGTLFSRKANPERTKAALEGPGVHPGRINRCRQTTGWRNNSKRIGDTCELWPTG
jgi:uncharacterized membrane protein YphA (DoxX/SURF4 family)